MSCKSFAVRAVWFPMTPKNKVWSLLFGVFLLAGCAGKSAAPHPQTAAEAPQAQFSQPGYSAPGGGSPTFGDAPAKSAPAPTPAASAAAPPSDVAVSSTESGARSSAKDDFGRDRREPSPQSRPGLGTEWGETRTSRVHDVTFVRDSARPFAVATLHYDDRRGVDAMANLHATRDTGRNVSTAGGAVTIAIKDATGNPLEAVRVGDRTLVVGQAGQRYSIVLTNHTDHRFESVVTVDGLDVVNGKPGSAENRGYVLLPFATLEIDGFRQSAAAVAAFRFAAVSESYAAQTGQARNVGVIGVALFSERGDMFVNAQELRMRDTANPFPADPRFAQPPRR